MRTKKGYIFVLIFAALFADILLVDFQCRQFCDLSNSIPY